MAALIEGTPRTASAASREVSPRDLRLLALCIVLGVALRLLLMPFTAYGDLHGIAYALHLLPYHGVLDVYSTIRAMPPEQMPVPKLDYDFFPYPPLAYFTLGGAMALLRPFYGDEYAAAAPLLFDEFLRLGPRIFPWLFLLKLPLLAADLGIGATLAALGTSAGQRLRLAALWALNPIPIIAAYLFGQFDVLPALCLVLACLLAQRGRDNLGALALGLGAGLKLYGLLLIPIYLLLLGRTTGERVRLGAVALGTFALSLVPLLLDPVGPSAIANGVALQRVANAGIYVGEMFDRPGILSPMFILYTGLVLHAARRADADRSLLVPYLLGVLLIVYSFNFGHLQWFTSAAVLLTLDWLRNSENRLVDLVMYGAVIVIALSWQVGPFLEFFAPVQPGLASAGPSFWRLLPEELGRPVVDAVRSALAGAALFWVYANVIRPAAGGGEAAAAPVFTRANGHGDGNGARSPGSLPRRARSGERESPGPTAR